MMLLFWNNDIQWTTTLAVVLHEMQFNTIFFMEKCTFCREPYSFESNGIMGNTDDSLDKKATIKWQTKFASSSASRNNKAALVARCRITWIPQML